MKIVRGIGAVIAGLIVFLILLFGADWTSRTFLSFPPRPEIWQDSIQASAFLATLSTRDLLLVLAGWLIATFAAAWVATKIARGPIAGFIAGALLLATGIVNAFIIPQPLWFSIASFVIYISATVAGVRMGMPRQLAYA